ncbi:MAG: MBL fold metallo-hydrolase [Verrucomicrobia bacterium]|nr:MBL fold metallo-hydrolase [Verrucomicrobiota bacterium]
MILEVICTGPADTNAYLIGCEKTKKAALIDAPFDCTEMVSKRAQALSLDLTALYLTHTHWDHTADAHAIKEKFHIPVYVHPEDLGNLEKPGSDGLPMYFKIQPAQHDFLLKNGEILSVGELLFEVIHTPGHTPGGVCFYFKEEKVLFSGDTLFRGTIGNLSFPTARPALMWESLKTLALLPPETRVYPGHGGPTTIGQEGWIAHAEQISE